jgi:CarD family transcriptional regulator
VLENKGGNILKSLDVSFFYSLERKIVLPNQEDAAEFSLTHAPSLHCEDAGDQLGLEVHVHPVGGEPMFRIGTKVVYPGHGVGVIEGINEKSIQGIERKFFILRILENNMTIMIPTGNVASVGLRSVISKEMVSKVYRILRTRKPIGDLTNWNRRYREYSEKIKTGSVVEIAKILRDLLVLRSEKELSFGERTMLDTARNLLVKELAIASKHSEEKILEDLRMMFSPDAARLQVSLRS